MDPGFWKFDNLLLKDTDFVMGYNRLIKSIMKQYSQQLWNLDDPKYEDYPQARWDISPVLLHDVVLMEVRSYTMKYKALKKMIKELLMIGHRAQIDELQDSN